MKTRFLAALLLSLALPAQATTIGQTTLGKLISGSHAIVVGKVLRVVDVATVRVGKSEEVLPRTRIAEVEVYRWVKGSPRPKRIWYLAEGGTSGADWSSAVEGEKVLLFLDNPAARIQPVDEDLRDLLTAPTFWRRVKAITGGAPLRALCWAGRGRMPVEHVEGREYARLDAYYVSLPADTPSIPGPDPRFDEHERRVPLNQLVGITRRRLAPDPRGGRVRALLDELDADTDLTPSRKADGLLEALDAAAVAALLDLLDDPSYPRRDTVAEALCGMRDEGMAMLVDGLRSKDAARRRAAAFALEWGARVAIDSPDERLPEVVEAAKDPDAEARARAVAAVGALGALGALRKDEAAAVVVAALTDESALVRRWAVRTLLRSRVGFFRVPEGAETALRSMAAVEDAALRREVWEALARVAGPATLPAALSALGDADRVVRVCAVRALGRIRDREATGRLLASLGSKDPWVRRAAAHTIGVGKVADGVEPLIRALGDADTDVVAIAIESLGEIGPPAAAAVPALTRVLETSESTYLRSQAEEALGKIRS